MKELIVNKGLIYINGIKINVDEYLTKEYLEYINFQSKRFDLPKSLFANEIFHFDIDINYEFLKYITNHLHPGKTCCYLPSVYNS